MGAFFRPVFDSGDVDGGDGGRGLMMIGVSGSSWVVLIKKLKITLIGDLVVFASVHCCSYSQYRGFERQDCVAHISKHWYDIGASTSQRCGVKVQYYAMTSVDHDPFMRRRTQTLTGVRHWRILRASPQHKNRGKTRHGELFFQRDDDMQA